MKDSIEKLKEVFLNFLKDEDVKIILFGSRALILLREYIEELNIPYKVEIVDFSAVSEEFKKIALKEAIVWKD